jgi:hypothetical protein
MSLTVITSKDSVIQLDELEAAVEGITDSDAQHCDHHNPLRTLLKEMQDYGVETLVRYDYFTDYLKELIEDCDLPDDLAPYIVIDWEKTALNCQVDWCEFQFEWITYWGR